MTIKEIRLKHNLTQQQLADIIGCPIKTIRNWEQGERECKEYLLNLIEHYVAFHNQPKEDIQLNVSYECSELIAELKMDIAECGPFKKCYAFWETHKIKIPFSEEYVSVDFLVNYDFIVDEEPLTEEEKANYRIEKSTFGEVLKILEKQNRI